MDDDAVCRRCEHPKSQHSVRVGADADILRVDCEECPSHQMRGFESVHRINHHERTVDIEDRYLLEVTVPRSCWSISESVGEGAKWSTLGEWRPCDHRVASRRLIEDRIDPDVEKPAFARLQQDLCCGCQHPLPTHVLEIDHIIPKSKGGGDQARNIQLLCSKCNKIKGSRSMEYLRDQVRKTGIPRPDLVRSSPP